MKKHATMKTMPSSGSAQRSKKWIRLCPNVAIGTGTTTTTKNASQNGRLKDGKSDCRAKAPLTLLTMNQPNDAVSPFRAAGRMFPRNPKGPRLTIIIGTPNLGPHEESTAWEMEP